MARLRKKRKKQSKGIIKTSVLKIVVISIILGLNWTGISAVLETFAFFSNNEDSNANTFTAATLDFSLRSGQGDFISPAENMKPGNSTARDIYINKLPNSLPLKHSVSYNFIDGNEDFCNQLQLKVWYNHYFDPPSGGYVNRDMRLKYDGPLTSLANLTDADFIIPHPDDQFDTDSSDGTEQWFYYSIIMPGGINDSYQGESCHFKFIFDGWQTNFPDSSLGFSDQEEITNFLQSGKWIIDLGDVVINELMWMGSRGSLSWGDEWPEDEWIELRNTTHYPIDLGGWKITKKTSSGEELMLEIPSGTIPAHGFFLVSNFDKDNSRIDIDPDLMDSNVDLRNRDLQIKLYKGVWQDPNNLIDTADDGKGRPLAGFRFLGFLHFSMEREDAPGDGTLGSSWHTCWDDSVEMRVYWDPLIIFGKSINRGTPGGRNLSDYDETELIEYYQQLEEEWIAEGLFVPDPIFEEENYDEEEIPEIPVGEELPVEEETLLEEEEPPIEEAPIIEEEPIQEEVPVPEDEITTEEIIETSGEITEDVIEDVVEEVVEATVTEETPADEAPAAEEQPAVLPDDDFSTQTTTGESEGDVGSGDGGDDTSLDSDSPTESVVESSSD